MLVGYKTFPHVDIRETGEKAASLLLRMMQGEVRPTIAHTTCGVLPNMLRQVTAEGVMAEVMAFALREEEAGALDVSVFGGFSLADSAFTGISVVATTDGDLAAAEAICCRMRAAIQKRRDGFQGALEPLVNSCPRQGVGQREASSAHHPGRHCRQLSFGRHNGFYFPRSRR